MFSKKPSKASSILVPGSILSLFRIAATIAVVCVASLVAAQTQSGQTSQQPANNQQNQQQNQNPTPGEAGGPKGDIGPIAVPKKGDNNNDASTKKDVPTKPKPIEGMPNFSINVSVPVVTLDVGVLTKDGMFVPGLKQNQFRVLEDGVPQTIASFNQTQGPITAVILTEFANNDVFYQFAYDSLIASYTFAQTLRKEDWIALITYDMRAHIVQDFTQDKRAIQASVSMLQPGMSMSQETNLFDALYDTIDRLEGVEGRKYVILVSSGRDTFSKKTLDQCLKKVQGSKDIAIYSIGTGQALRNYLESHGALRYPYACDFTDFSCSTTYAQADNQMRSFAKMTGGKAYFPLFQASFRDDFGDIANTIRNQYSISYHPTNRNQDGSFRKIKVELVDEAGQPLKMRNEKGKDLKYQIVAREGYKAKLEVE
ncbi:MAG TPA: VWA domain-containing protein [Candidatus Angelobacter sp.]